MYTHRLSEHHQRYALGKDERKRESKMRNENQTQNALERRWMCADGRTEKERQDAKRDRTKAKQTTMPASKMQPLVVRIQRRKGTKEPKSQARNLPSPASSKPPYFSNAFTFCICA